jgi:gas vesicle protein
MDWTKQTQDLFKTWTDVQKRTWEGWLDTVKSFDASQPGQIWVKTIDAWQETIRNTLAAQVEGSRIWTENITSVQGAPKGTADWAQQVQEMTKRWTDLQQQMWDNWFEIMKKTDPSKFAGNWETEGQSSFVKAWQETVQKSMDSQAELTRQWVGVAKGEK